MSNNRIEEKVSAIVSSQLPEFIQSDFPLFVSFIEAYYKFLEQDQAASELLQNSRDYNDLDYTVDSFVQYFLNTYAPKIPANVLTDKKLLVKKINDLYQAKGSELSFKLLFRILFDTDVSVNYPYQNVLRASDGKWQQRFSIRVETVSGDRNLIADRFLTYISNGVEYNTPILQVKILTSTLSEIFLDSNQLAPSYLNGTSVSVLGNGQTIFEGIIRPTTTTYSILRGGEGFKLGQIFTINVSGGVQTLVKVTGVTTNGAITTLQFINYGYNYTPQVGSFFTIQLSPNSSVSLTAELVKSRTQGFSEDLKIQKILPYDPFSAERYFLEDYIDASEVYSSTIEEEEIIQSEYTFSTFTTETPENVATVIFGLGALAKYPGSYFTNDSFLSEAEVRLQDDQLYQPFAYQTVTGIDISEFFDIVKELIHPAGQKLFNLRQLEAFIDLSANLVLAPTSNIAFEAYSSAKGIDSEFIEISKLFEGDLENVDAIDEEIININKPLVDDLETNEFEVKEINKVIQEERYITYDPLSPEIYFAEDYLDYSDPDQIYTFTDFLVIPEGVFVVDEVFVGLVYSRNVDDSISFIDATTLTKDVEIVTFSETEVVTESVLIQINERVDYFLEDYTEDDYAFDYEVTAEIQV